MELKEYQTKALNQVRGYLDALARWDEKAAKVAEVAGVDAAPIAAEKAWVETTGSMYKSRRNGLGRVFPDFCLKIPTGGGKTLLAVKTLDLIQSSYLKRRAGFVLWIVPTTQIYRQTLQALRDRSHPYRQHLDNASGGRTLLLEKTDAFAPQDTSENLVVMLLMLPSASRQNKETLKLFQDSGGFGAFFPPEEDADGNRKLLERVPNLDAFGGANEFYGRQVKTSLGNALRVLTPVIVLDEGHKAYSDTAQATLAGFNPCFLVELSATPNKDRSNVLVDIPGVELAREEMIKLDLHVNNKATADWKMALLESVKKLGALREKAQELESNGGPYIRPMALIQVERTGKEQRGKGMIHAEDVREYLIQKCNAAPEEVAVKSSEKDDIEGLDLLSRECPIRYIVTKQALQEGWDCPFAYVLTVLTNPGSKTALTQLVGRILRQPYARKTKIQDLDESYVVCFQQKGVNLLKTIKEGFEREGLGDLSGRIALDQGAFVSETREIGLHKKFEKFAGRIYLPVFVIHDGTHWRKVSHEMDIVSRIDWDRADFEPVSALTLSMVEDRDVEFVYGLDDERQTVVREKGMRKLEGGALEIDGTFVVRHLLDLIPNPWVAHEIVERVLGKLKERYAPEMLAGNLVFVIEELRKRAAHERDRLSQIAFDTLVKAKKIRFLMIKDDPASRLASHKTIRKDRKTLTRRDNQPLERSLFDFVPEDDLNLTEKAVAWYLDEQEKLLWWYRSISRQDYAIQGWRKNRIYPDFILSTVDPKDRTEYDRVLVVETKGLHLKNEDTSYKQEVFDLCNRLAEEKSWSELGLEFAEKKVVFEVVFSDEWQRELNELISV
ncbi:MAG: DEAD/DEAH box helicase family protein [Planctomycetes bacterium]|nr:DEAD/DEAH box helicase family protein [Planctomycetota bacterium]